MIDNCFDQEKRVIVCYFLSTLRKIRTKGNFTPSPSGLSLNPVKMTLLCEEPILTWTWINKFYIRGFQ